MQTEPRDEESTYEAEADAADDAAPEGVVEDLDLAKHTDGYWPSSSNSAN